MGDASAENHRARAAWPTDTQVIWMFAASLFLGTALLCSIQPLFTKMVLPLLGGSPVVWSSALLFFQLVLLADYLYAHSSSRLLGIRAQLALYMLVLPGAFSFLPVPVATGWAHRSAVDPPSGWSRSLSLPSAFQSLRSLQRRPCCKAGLHRPGEWLPPIPISSMARAMPTVSSRCSAFRSCWSRGLVWADQAVL